MASPCKRSFVYSELEYQRQIDEVKTKDAGRKSDI